MSQRDESLDQRRASGNERGMPHLDHVVDKMFGTVDGQKLWSAPERRVLDELTDTLLVWDPKILHEMWMQRRIELNLTRLRRLAHSLERWREPGAALTVLEELARRSERRNDKDTAERYRRAHELLQMLEGTPRAGNLYIDSRDDLVVRVTSADALSEVDHDLDQYIGTHRGVGVLRVDVPRSRDRQEMTTDATIVRLPKFRSFADLGSLLKWIQAHIVPAAIGKNVLTVIAPATALGHVVAALIARELRSPIVSELLPDERFPEAVDSFARTLGMGDRPILPSYDDSKTELLAQCLTWRNGVSTVSVATTDGAQWALSEQAGAQKPQAEHGSRSRVGDSATPSVVALEQVLVELRSAGRARTKQVIERCVRSLRELDMANPTDWFPARDNSVEELLSTGWRFAEFPPVPLDLPLDWDGLASSNRSWNFQFHSWRFMDAAMNEYLRTGDRNLVLWCVDRAVSWSARFVDADPGEALAWYDMALGLRSARLSVLLWVAAKEDLDETRLSCLLQLARAHAKEHRKPESFNPRSNHGFYAALGQSLLGRVLECEPSMKSLADEGATRLGLMLEQQFAADGGHREHSPDYHRMVLGSFIDARDAGLVKDPEVLRRIERAAHILAWFILPNGEMLQFGDSPARNMTQAGNRVTDPHAKFIATDGKIGTPAVDETIVLPESGYAIVRSPQPSQAGARIDSSYLAVQAGFHSRTHKHADDLTIVWFDRKLEILVDGGRYGYGELLPRESPLRAEGHYYADPMRRYVESSLAHNTVMVGEVDHDRRRQPYGAAEIKATYTSGVHRILATASHESWEHTREIQLIPGAMLRVEDSITKAPDDVRMATIRFNLAGHLKVVLESAKRLRVDHRKWNSPLWISQLAPDAEPLELVRGLEEPLLGWRSKVDRQVEPTWNLGWRIEQNGPISFTTLFEFGDKSAEPTRGVI